MMAKAKKAAAPPAVAEAQWTFLTNHAHVLLSLAQDPEALMRDVAAAVGVTERAVQRIVAELEAAGYLVKSREGRRNRYEVKTALPLRHPIERHCEVGHLVRMVTDPRRRRG